MEEPKENKALPPSPSKGQSKKVKVKIRQNRAITGVGKAGDVVEMDEAQARMFEHEGFVTILKPFE